MAKKLHWRIWLSGVVGFFILQLAFLKADPSLDISTSRGPFTDEGLNTIQARNYVNQGKWGLDDCDNLAKSPAYNAYLLVVFQTFGTSRTVARMSVLVASLLFFMLFTLLIKKPSIGLLWLLLGGLQYHLFQFFHFSMVEALAIQVIMVSLAFAYRFIQSKSQHVWWLILHFSGLFLALCLKVQFAYVLVLPLCTLLIWKRERLPGRLRFFRAIGLTSFLYGIAGLAYWLLWYQRVKPVFDKVVQQQLVERYHGDGNLLKALWGNLETFWLQPENLFIQLIFWLSLVWLTFKRKQLHQNHRLLFFLSAAWALLEHHKLFIQWLPSRYALSLIAAQALVIALFLKEALRHSNPFNKYLGVTALVIVLSFPQGNVRQLITLFRERTYQSQRVIDHFESYDFKGRKIAGTWATAIVWNQSAYVFPVWKDFTPMASFLEKHRPLMVVTEKDQEDSNRAFTDSGIVLEEYFGPARPENYGPYSLFIYALEEFQNEP